MAYEIIPLNNWVAFHPPKKQHITRVVVTAQLRLYNRDFCAREWLMTYNPHNMASCSSTGIPWPNYNISPTYMADFPKKNRAPMGPETKSR